MPIISVIIPAYNAQNTIIETISSVLNQTFTDLEIIVIDDGSTDKTCEYVRAINDRRIKLFAYENGGVAKARNRGISHVQGEYIAFLDHDDLWTPDKLEAQISALIESPDAGVAYSWTVSMYSEEDPVRYHQSDKIYFEGDVYPQILLSNFIANGSNILVRAKAVKSIGDFDAIPISNEDLDFYIRLAAKWNFVLVPKHQIIYRTTSISMSSNVSRMERGGIILADKAFESAPEDLKQLKNRFLFNHYIYCAKLYIKGYVNSAKSESSTNIKNAYRTSITAFLLMPSAFIQPETFKLIFKLLFILVVPPTSMKQLMKAKRKYFNRQNTNNFVVNQTPLTSEIKLKV
jgi:glycosyltransferase involved in cell wall biosynthesis